MKTIAIICLLIISSVVHARRRAPEPVPSIVHDGVEYVAPLDNGSRGYIVARNPQTQEIIWEKTIFRIFIIPFKEEDIQHVYIKSMTHREDHLVIVDERDRHFSLDLRTREVQRQTNTE